MSKMAVVYWSQTGNTEAMANAIANAAQEAGAEVNLSSVDATTPANTAEADLIALGCPSMGDEVLEEDEFEPFFSDLESQLSGKKVALFGSYGWGDGQWMRDWQDRVEKAGAQLYNNEGLIINETPDEDGLEQCAALGKGFAAF